MRDLTAQVTSSLLPFPGVTIDALGEDEIILDSVLQGKLTVGRSGVAWLACGPQLEVVHAVTGERLSAYCFSGEGEHPPNILAARDFSWLKRSGLLVGLEEVEGSMLCLYDLGLSRVVKAVVIPGRITSIEPLVSYGGASTSTQHLHQSLRWFFGIAAVVTDLGHVLLVDLCLDDLSCSQSELEASDLEVVTKSPAEIPRLREASSRQGRHLCLQLSGPSGTKATALQYISRTNQVAVGFSDGYLQLWNMKTLKKEYHSQLEAGKVPVYAFTFQEPENDPRNCCYLWAVQSAQELEGDVVSLHLLQLAFSERKCMASGKILYEGLEYCEERYSQDVSGAAFPLRAQATNTRLLSCQTIEKFRPHPDRDDSMNEAASPDTSVSVFSWQVKAYGQGKPTTCIGVFDINRWYHAQMPDSLRAGESLHSCPYLAVWSLDPVVEMVSPHLLLDIVVHDRSLSRGSPSTWPPPEQFFNPTTYNFDATCLLNSGIVHLTCSGHQKETLSFLKKAAPSSSDFICSSYTRCLMSGLLSSRQADSHHASPSQEEQLDAILCTAVETSSLGLITGCIKQWTAEEQPGSALNLRFILEWAWNKVVHTKEELDGICAPLFDSSSNFTDPQTLQLLQHSQRLLGNLSAIFHCLLSEAQELTQRGLVGLMNKNMVSSLISQYAQVVLWFCRTGLLPEGSDEDALQISRPFYTHAVISSYYTIRREELTRLAKGKWCADCLMIDGLVSQCGDRLVNLWKRDEGGTGQYPPPTLHALLDIYLLEDMDEAAKHAIVIYLLLDVMYSFPNKGGASVESFPTAFAIPIGLVKLVQGLWLLDHHDHQRSLELLLHPTTSQCHFAWQHQRVLQALMCQGQHAVALRYLHVTKPPLSCTSQAKLCLSVLLHNRCLVEAWSMLRQHSTRLSMDELLGFLYESCQELGLIKELLKLPLGLTEQESLEKFLQGTGGLQNRELLMVHYLQQANYIPALQLNQSLKMNLVNERDPKLKERSNSRNAILDQYGKVLPRVQRRLAMERAKPYQHPATIHREVNRPQPLSTIAKRSANDKVMSRAGFINNVLTKIEEVWLGKGANASPAKSPRASEPLSPESKPYSNTLSDPFLGTPIAMTAKRKSRLVDLVVHPSCQTPRVLLTPPRAPGSQGVPPRSICRAPELGLLQTPQVVKRARALAASGSVFAAFTPHSILRSSLRPTPVATPSASPGRSVTPPPRGKESRITFIEETASPEMRKGAAPWSNGTAADSEISLLARGSPLPGAALKHWAARPPERDPEDSEEPPPRVKFMPPAGGVPSPPPQGSDSESSSVQEDQMIPATRCPGSLSLPPGSLPGRLSLGLETSMISVQSSDSTLEFHDAPLALDPEEQEEQEEQEEEDVVVLNIKAPAEQDGPTWKSITATEQEQQQQQQEEEEEEEREEEEQGKEEDAQGGFTFQGDDQGVCPQQQQQQQAQQNTEEEVLEIRPEEEAQEPRHTEEDEALCLAGDQGTAEVCDTRVEVLGQAEKTFEQSQFTEHPEATEASGPLHEPTESLEHTTDLTEFVERHLFGEDTPSPLLTRSGIHDTSDNWTSFNSEPACEAPEENKPVAEAPMFTSQKSVTSITSSEQSGSDSHSVVSVNDSEELSSPASEEEEEEEEEEDEEDDEEAEGSDDSEEKDDEEEDSDSEVEIIEEVQGNRTLVSLQPGPPAPLFEDEGLPHFLPRPSEELSLIPAEAELKMAADGDVVMVRLGGLGGGNESDDGSGFTKLKPSTTLLVPVELVEGHGHSLVDGAQLGLTVLGKESEQDSPTSGAHSSFSLMLEMDDDADPDADTLPMDQQALQLAVQGITDQLDAPPEAILQDMNDPEMHFPPSEDALDLLVAEDPMAVAEDPVVEDTDQMGEEGDRVVYAADPVVEAEDPLLEAEDPLLEAEDPLLEAEDPVAEAEDPVAEAEDPMAEAEDHGAEAEGPGAEAEDPGAEAGDPVTEAEDHGAEAEDPGAEAEDHGAEAEDHGADAEDPVAESEDPVAESEDPGAEAEDPGAEAEDPGAEAEDHGAEAEDHGAEAEVHGAEAEVHGAEAEDPVVEADDPVVEAEDPVADVDTLDAIDIDDLMESHGETQPDLSAAFSSQYFESNNVFEKAAEEKEGGLLNTEVNNEEPESVSLEVPVAVPNKAAPTSRYAALEAMMEESAYAPSENTLVSDGNMEDLNAVPEEHVPVQTDGHEGIFPNKETVATLEEDHEQTEPEEKTDKRMEEFNTLQEESRRRTRKRASEHQGDQESHVRQVFSPEDPLDPEPSSEKPTITTTTTTTTSSQKGKNAPSTPTRRGRKTVTFTSSTQEEAEDPRPEEDEEEEEDPGEVSMTLRRGTRVRRQSQKSLLQADTPRRSTRKTQRQAPNEEEQEQQQQQEEEVVTSSEGSVNNDTAVPRTTPAKRRTPQKASPSRAGRRTRSTALEEVEEEEEEVETEEAMDDVHESRSKGPTPAKRQTRQSATPRRASRRTASLTDDTAVAEEENRQAEDKQESVGVTGYTRISRIRYFEAQPALLEVEEDEQVVEKKAASSPSRATRTVNRKSVSVQQQVTLVKPRSPARTRGGASAAKPKETHVLTADAPPTANSRRPTRSKLWDHSEEYLPFLDPPLEVDSETPVADALIKRLKDEEEKEGGPVHQTTVGASKRKSKASAERDPSPDDAPAPEPENNPTKDSFIYSPSRRRTRNNRGGSPILTESALPSRTRRARGASVDLGQNESVSPDDAASTATVSKSRTMIKSTAKTPAALAPLASADLISPLPSPAEAAPRAQRRTEEGGDDPAAGATGGPRVNRRRKRIMDAVFTKPVTRRKKL